MNKKIISSIVIGMLIIAAAIFYWQWTKSPIYSLKQLVNAIRQHDRDEVEKYMDVESVANCVMDQFFAQIPQDQAPDNQWAVAGQAMARGFLELMKPKLSAMAKDKFLNYVETGKFRDSPDESGPAANISNVLKTTTTETQFKGIKSVKKEGKIALVTLDMMTTDQREISPEIRMRDKGGYWQIIDVTNAAAILQNDSPTSRLVVSGATVEIPNFEKWVTSRKSESDLRSLDINKVYKKGQEQEFATATFKRWSDQCAKESDYSCRLASYLLDAEGNSKEAVFALRRACTSGKDLHACYGLTINEGAPIEIKIEATRLISEKCSDHIPRACLYAGYESMDKGQKGQALSFFDESCKGGDLQGCGELGFEKYNAGQKEEAVGLVTKACDGGDSDGCFNLGYMREEEKDTPNAMLAYKKGCEAGNARACLGVGELHYQAGKMSDAFMAWAQTCNYLEGKGCLMIGLTLLEQNGDKGQAKEMIARGCTLGEIDACKKIGMHKPAWL